MRPTLRSVDANLGKVNARLITLPSVPTGTPAGVGMGMRPPNFLKKDDEMLLVVDKLGKQRLKVVEEK